MRFNMDEEMLQTLQELATARYLNDQERLLEKIAKTEGAFERLVPYLDNDSRRIQLASIMALGRFGPNAAPAVDKLTEKLKYRSLRHQTLAVLAEIGPAAAPAVPSLIRVLKKAVKFGKDEIPNAQLACSALAKIGEPAQNALPELRRCAELDSDGHLFPFLSLEAAEAIWIIAGEAEPAVQLANRLLESPDWSPIDCMDGECEVVIDLLGKIGPSANAAIPILERAMNTSESDAIKKRIVDALVKIGGQK
jgi:HEAT repeat protein